MGFKGWLVTLFTLSAAGAGLFGYANDFGAGGTYMFALMWAVAISWVAVMITVSRYRTDAKGHVENKQACSCLVGALSWMFALIWGTIYVERVPVQWHPFMFAMVVTLSILWQWLVAVDSQLTLLFWVGLTGFATLVAACYPVAAAGWVSVPATFFVTALLSLVVGTFKRRGRQTSSAAPSVSVADLRNRAN